MTRRRFFAPPHAFSAAEPVVQLPSDEARHLSGVLRLRVGDEIFVFDGQGREFQCRINGIARNAVHVDVIGETTAAKPEPPIALTLLVALLKGEKFDLVVQKATELGVVRIVPVLTERGDVRLKDKSDAAKRVERWNRIALEAAKQCGRAFVPQVELPQAFADSMFMKPETTRVMFSERDGESLHQVVRSSSSSEIIALTGSEGGWTGGEIESARDSGWQIVTLGGRILRAETAAIVAVSLLQHLFGDLK